MSTDDMKTTADDEVSGSDLAEVMRARAANYRLLARLYRKEVDTALLRELLAMKFPLKTGTPEIDKGYRLLRSYLSHVWEGTLTELAVDYARTFIGHGNTAYSAAYPFESVYTSPRRLLMQEARDEVLALYRAAGWDKSDDWHDGEDHIALELEFAGALCDRAAQALVDGDEDSAYALTLQQQSFLNDHLSNWIPLMLADLRRFAKTDFYQGLGALTSGLLTSERKVLAELLAGGASDDQASAAEGCCAQGEGERA